MFSNLAMTLMGTAEAVLTILLTVLFYGKGLHSRYPAMAQYLALRAVSVPALGVLLWATQSHNYKWYVAYFYTFWPTYIVSCVLLYFVCSEVFRSALSPFPGLQRLGKVVFRWTAVVSLIISFALFPWGQNLIFSFPVLATRLLRSISILELCLLAFMCLCMNTLKLSARDMAFGIALGLGGLAADDFMTVALAGRAAGLTDFWQFAGEAVTLAVWAVWIVYALLPQRERKPVVVPVNSPIYRWNEIATALGYGTKVAVQPAASSFFLTDVERVVERVLARNLKEDESKS